MEKFLHLITEGGNVFIIGIGGGIIAALFGSWLPLMTTLLIIQGADILTGVLSGGKDKAVSSKSFFSGLKKKVGMWILIIIANIIDNIAFGGMPVAKTAATSFLIAGEGLSIVENLGILGVPIPQFISNYLQKLKDENDQIDITEKESDITDEK